MKKRILAFALVCIMVVAALPVSVFAAETCDHAGNTSGKIVRQVVATCTTPGYTIRECDLCGEQYYSDYTLATGKHNYQPMADSAATCTEPAKKGGAKCTVCGKIDPNNKPATVPGSVALGHDWKEVIVSSETDCTVGTTRGFKCTRCNKTPEKADADEKNTTLKYEGYYAVVIAPGKGAHDFSKVTVITAPTTCKDGLAEYACANDGCTVTKTATIAAAHDYKDIPNTSWPCAQYKSGQQCTICGKLKDAVSRTDVKHNWAQVTTLKTISTTLKNKLIAAGYTSDDKLSKAATCTATGFKVVYCTYCEAWEKQTTNALGHAWSIGIKDAETATGEAAKTYCTTEAYQYRKCTRSGCTVEEKLLTITEAVKHVSVVEYDYNNDGVFAADEKDNRACEVTYQYRTVCSKCKAVLVAPALGAAKEHTWSAWSNVLGDDCTQGFYKTRTCGNKNCPYNKVENCTKGTDGYQQVAEPTTHNMSTGSDIKVVEGNCVTESYSAHYCKNPYCKVTEKIDGTETAKVPGKHVSPSEVNKNYAGEELTGMEQILKTVASTCTATGSVKFICECGVERTLTIPKKDHTIVTGEEIELEDGTKVDLRAVAPTCAADGWKAGKGCSVCGTVTVPRVVDPKTPNKHTGDQTFIKHEDKTCIAYAYTKYFCPTCNTTYTVTDTESGFGEHKEKTVQYNPAKCEEAGNYEYIVCEVCEAIKTGSIVCYDIIEGSAVRCTSCSKSGCTANVKHTEIIMSNNPTIAALGHDLKTIEKVAETCDTKGTTAYTKCTRCDYENGKRDIPAHGNAYYVEFKEVAKTCTTKGFGFVDGKSYANLKLVDGKYYYCSQCDINKIVKEIPASHNWGEEKTSTSADCTAAKITYRECLDCHKIETLTYTAGQAAHNWGLVVYEVKVDTNGVDVIDTGKGNMIVGSVCVTNTYKYNKCANPYCEEINKFDEVKATGVHYYFEDNGRTKVEIDLTCKGIAAFDDKTTYCCGKTVRADVEEGSTDDRNSTLGYSHKRVTVDTKPTCTTNGLKMDYCSICGKEFAKVEVIEAKNPNHNPAKCTTDPVFMENVPATSKKDGYQKYRCPDCNEIVTYVIPALGGLKVSAVVADKNNAFNGGTVSVDLMLEAEDVVFNTITYTLYYDEGLSLASYTKNFVADGYLVNITVNENGNQAVAIVTVADKNGAPANLTIASANKSLATLTFNVDANAVGAKFTGASAEGTKLNKDGESEALLDPQVARPTDFATSYVGDANADGVLDVNDSFAIQIAVIGGTYNGIVDFNKDGVVDLLDYAAFMKFLSSDKKLYDRLVLQSFDFASYVAASGLVDVDLDKNGVAGDAGDINLTVAKLVSVLKTKEYSVVVDLDEAVETILGK